MHSFVNCMWSQNEASADKLHVLGSGMNWPCGTVGTGAESCKCAGLGVFFFFSKCCLLCLYLIYQPRSACSLFLGMRDTRPRGLSSGSILMYSKRAHTQASLSPKNTSLA